MNNILELLDYIPEGKHYRISSYELGIITGLSGSSIRKIVNTLRCTGIPICSDDNGYYIATTKAELHSTIEHLLGRISSMRHAVDGLLEAERNLK